MGPLLGSLLYSLGGYTFTFYSFGGIFLLFAFFIKIIFPSKIDETEQVEKMHSLSQNLIAAYDKYNLQQENIGYIKLLKIRRYLLASLTGSIGYFLYGYIEPTLAFRLAEFSLNQMQIGLFFTIMPIFYIGTSIGVQFIPRGIQRRAIMISALFLSFFVNICVGPS